MGNETTILDVRAAQAVIEADRQERIVGEQRIPVPVQVIAR